MARLVLDDYDGLPLWEFSPGEAVYGGFRMAEPLGEGHRCESWHARHPRHGSVVVKLCRPYQTEPSRGVRSLRREAEALAAVDHPQVRRLIEDRTTSPVPALVLSFAHGPSLADVLVNGPLPVPRAEMAVAALAGALESVHRAGFVHLDVKPSNVVLDATSGPTLIDFGSARRIGYDPGDGTPLGSPGYAAPELEDNQPVAPAVDVFGLGTVLYEALTGTMAFDPDVDATGRPQATPPGQTNPDSDPELDRLVLRILDPDPDRRPTLAALRRTLDKRRHRADLHKRESA